AFVNRSSAFFPPRANVIYRQPSRLYAQAFLRVGNVQTSKQYLDAFFFWLLPHLWDRSAIVTESWSISSIGLHAARSLECYTGRERECDFDTLSIYQDGSEARAAAALDVFASLIEKNRMFLS